MFGHPAVMGRLSLLAPREGGQLGGGLGVHGHRELLRRRCEVGDGVAVERDGPSLSGSARRPRLGHGPRHHRRPCSRGRYWPVSCPGDRQCRPKRHGRHGPGRARPVRGLPRWGRRRGHNRALVGGRRQHRQRHHGRRDRIVDLGEPRPAGHRHQRAELRFRRR